MSAQKFQTSYNSFSSVEQHLFLHTLNKQTKKHDTQSAMESGLQVLTLQWPICHHPLVGIFLLFLLKVLCVRQSHGWIPAGPSAMQTAQLSCDKFRGNDGKLHPLNGKQLSCVYTYNGAQRPSRA